MSQRNFLTALILLLLPLSFGLDSSAGARTRRANGENSIPPITIATPGNRITNAAGSLVRRSVIPDGYTVGPLETIETGTSFVSSFDKNMIPNSGVCERSPTANDDSEIDVLNEDCASGDGDIQSVDGSAVSFPLQESFNGSDSFYHSNLSTGIPTPGGSGRRSANAPISAPEPGSLVLLTSGLIALAGIARRRSRRLSRIHN